MTDFEIYYEGELIEDFNYLTELLKSNNDIFVKLTTNDASNAEQLSTFEHYTQIVEVSTLLLEILKERRIRLNNLLKVKQQNQSQEETVLSE